MHFSYKSMQCCPIVFAQLHCSKSSLLIFLMIHEFDVVHLHYYILSQSIYVHIFRCERKLVLHLLKLQKHIWEAERRILTIGQYCMVMILHQHHLFQHLPLSHRHAGLVPWYKISVIIQARRVKEADLAFIIFPEPLILELSFQNPSPRYVEWLILVLSCKILILVTLFRW